MHVFVKGKGDHTVLLWSGLGTPAPVLDFEPLINELSVKFIFRVSLKSEKA